MPAPRAWRGQVVVSVLVLGLCLFAPRAGAGLLLLPCWPTVAAPGAPFLARHGLALIGAGRLPGSLVVHAAGPVPVGALLARGLVPLALPAALCGGRP
ncbi:MAG TPA: hypothetical protein VFF98_15895 [Novosphingobium sp.]|nr:hypothetical protein [Novosphingobium sp.]